MAEEMGEGHEAHDLKLAPQIFLHRDRRHLCSTTHARFIQERNGANPPTRLNLLPLHRFRQRLFGHDRPDANCLLYVQK